MQAQRIYSVSTICKRKFMTQNCYRTGPLRGRSHWSCEFPAPLSIQVRMYFNIEAIISKTCKILNQLCVFSLFCASIVVQPSACFHFTIFRLLVFCLWAAMFADLGLFAFQSPRGVPFKNGAPRGELVSLKRTLRAKKRRPGVLSYVLLLYKLKLCTVWIA